MSASGGFIEAAKSGPAVEDEFREHRDAAKTRGERALPPARPAGEGSLCLSGAAATST